MLLDDSGWWSELFDGIECQWSVLLDDSGSGWWSVLLDNSGLWSADWMNMDSGQC